MSLRRGILGAVALAVLVYVTAVPNGFAYDDTGLILANPVVQSGTLSDVLEQPYWPQAATGSGLFRPLTTAVFMAEWRLWGDWPLPYHLVSVGLHAGVTALVGVLAAVHLPPAGAVAAAALFAVHPVHTEAVANVSGQSELLAAALVLLGVLLFQWMGRSEGARLRALLLLPLVYALALGAKENGAMMPFLCVVSAGLVSRDRDRPFPRRTAWQVLALMAAVGLVYGLFRWGALGALTGDAPAAELRGLTIGQRLLTGLALWPEYVRLMVFPLSLAADYGPGVFVPALGVDSGVVLGSMVLTAAVSACLAFRRIPGVAVGAVWFAISVLPVSQLLFPAGTVLAERTLYLPSVGFTLVAAGVAVCLGRGRSRKVVAVVATSLVLAFGARTAVRNPAWLSTHDVFRVLHRDHPTSFLGQRARAAGLAEVGRSAEAAEAYRLAVSLSPRHYATLVEAGAFLSRNGWPEEADTLLARAARETPDQPLAYRLLSEHQLRQGRGRAAQRTATEGLRTRWDDPVLWEHLSKAYVIMGLADAAERARVVGGNFRPGQ